MAYLKKVPDAKKDSGVGNGWFKIQEGGYTNGKWATNVVIENKGNQVINIPSCIENGQYLLRAEMVALHGARSTNGAQLYVRSFCKLLRLKKRRLTTDSDGVCPNRNHWRDGNSLAQDIQHPWDLQGKCSHELVAMGLFALTLSWQSNDPGLLLDIYNQKAGFKYVIPGKDLIFGKRCLISTLTKPGPPLFACP